MGIKGFGTRNNYLGVRGPDGTTHVTVNGRPLPSTSVVPFDWGNTSPGAAALAKAILAFHLGRDIKDYNGPAQERFAKGVIGGLPRGDWQLARDDIHAALDFIEE